MGKIRSGLRAPVVWLRSAVASAGREREALVQAAKMAVAAVVAWLVARQVHDPQSFIAPYAAVFLMSETVYRSMANAAQQVAALLAGLLLAFVVATAIPAQLAALGVAVFAGMLLGRCGMFGGSGIWVGVIALLMLTYGQAENPGYLMFRAVDMVVGATVGLAVNLLVLPPVHLQNSRQAVRKLSGEIGEVLRALAGGLRSGWGRDDAAQWLRRARALESTVRRAEQALSRGRESTRLNPRRMLRTRGQAPALPAHDRAIGTLYELAKQTQRISETLLAMTDGDGVVPRTTAGFDEALAALLDDLAAVADRYQEPGRPAPDTPADLADAQRRRRELADRVGAGRYEPPEGWSSYGALLLAVQRALSTVQDDLAQDGGDNR